MKLGMVTYLWGKDWDLDTVIKNCAATGFTGVELRSTHKHGVEVTLSKAQRAEVKRKFDDSPVEFVGPGSACEFHDPDHGIVQRNIELTGEFVKLSADIGGTGVKVRPNRLVKGEDPQVTIARIGEALRECGKFAADHGQEIRVEVHGSGTKDPAVMRKIMDAADHPQVVVCWNSNPGETINGSIKTNFDLLKHKLGGTLAHSRPVRRAVPLPGVVFVASATELRRLLPFGKPGDDRSAEGDAVLQSVVRRTDQLNKQGGVAS